MPLHFSVNELKTIRNVYNELGISDSDVLRNVKEIIRLSHFSPDSIDEIADEMENFQKLTKDPKLGTYAQLVMAKAQTIAAIQDRAEQNRKVQKAGI